MSVRSRRRRALLLVSLALACGGLAASRVSSAERRVADQVGPLVPVLVARGEIPAGAKIAPDRLAVRQVPARFAPADALPGPQAAVGLRLSAAVAPGGYVTEGELVQSDAKEDRGGASVAPGERAIEVAVTGGEALASAAPGTRVDVLVTTDPSNGGGRTYLALQDVELLATRPSPGASGDGAAAHATTSATLRVTLRQAVYLTAAQSFAREIRLLARAPGDRGGAPGLAVDGRHL